MSERKHFLLSEEDIINIEKIKNNNHLKSNTETVKFAISSTANSSLENQIKELQHNIFLLKKYSNEMRRDNYRILSYLDAIALKLDIATSFPWHIETMFSPAHMSINKNLKEYLDAIITKNESNTHITGELDE